MAELTLSSHSGNIVPAQEEMLVSSELLGYLDSGNKVLGTSADPRFGDFVNFRDSIDTADITRIDFSDLSNGKFNDLDLTGTDDSVKDVEDYRFFGNISAEDFIKAMCISRFQMPYDEGEIIDKDYMPFNVNQILWSFDL